MITDTQYARLPEMMKEIVDNDQERAALRAPAIISLDACRAHRQLNQRRSDLRIGAKRLWGQNLNKNAAGANKRTGEDLEELSENAGAPE